MDVSKLSPAAVLALRRFAHDGSLSDPVVVSSALASCKSILHFDSSNTALKELIPVLSAELDRILPPLPPSSLLSSPVRESPVAESHEHEQEPAPVDAALDDLPWLRVADNTPQPNVAPLVNVADVPEADKVPIALPHAVDAIVPIEEIVTPIRRAKRLLTAHVSTLLQQVLDGERVVLSKENGEFRVVRIEVSKKAKP